MELDAKDKKRAPFTQNEVEKINYVQEHGELHPYTCNCCEISRVLVANKDGLFCSVGNYKQNYIYNMTMREYDLFFK